MFSLTTIRRVLLVLVLHAIAGCGFQLAGQQPLPDYLRSVSVVANDTRSDLYIALERALIARGIAVVSESPNKLYLTNVETDQRVLSVSVRNIPREYEVYYTVGYRFVRDAQVLLERPPITLTRDYTWSEFEVLGKAREEQLLRANIVDDLVDTILRQLATLD